MDKLHFALLAGCLLVGCSRPINLSKATFSVKDENWSKQTTYELLPDGQELLSSILSRKPDEVINAAIKLEPSGLLVLDGKRYAIEPDEIVFLGEDSVFFSGKRTKIWNQKDIRNDLIRKSVERKTSPTRWTHASSSVK